MSTRTEVVFSKQGKIIVITPDAEKKIELGIEHPCKGDCDLIFNLSLREAEELNNALVNAIIFTRNKG